MDEKTQETAVRLMDAVYDKKNAAGEFMKSHLIDLVVIAVMLVYIARTIATIGVADKTVFEIIADGALAFFFAVSVGALMQKKGLMTAEEDPKYVATMAEYAKAIELTTPFVDALEGFCERRNRDNERRAQTEVLRGYGISYEAYLKGFENPTEKQLEAMEKIRSLRIHRWTTQELVSECGTEPRGELYSFGKTERDFERKKSLLSIAMTAATAFIFGYFTLRLITEFSWAALVWSCVQVAFFLVKGATAFASAYSFKKNDYRNRIIYKTTVIYEFYNEQIKKEKDYEQLRLEQEPDERAADSVRAEPAQTISA